MVKFGQELQERQQVLQRVLKPEAFMDYERLRACVQAAGPPAPDERPTDVVAIEISGEDSSPPLKGGSDFFHVWDEELLKIRRAIDETMQGVTLCAAPCGPFRLRCSTNALSAALADALFECIELNRAGFRKIVKKYDKNNPRDENQQEARLKMFDVVMSSTMDEIEMQHMMTTQRGNKSSKLYQCAFITVVAIVVVVVLFATKATNMRVAFVLGLIGGGMTAWGNASNDICNSVGTAVGARALTLAQAVLLGAIFEVVGCLTLGPYVSKSIVKGIISAQDYEDTPTLYAYGMVCVLFGAGLTTLLATFYGFPISATHGIIGGLIAVGVAAKGTESVDWDGVGRTVLGWVAAPLVGGLVSILVFALMHFTIHRAPHPAQRSRKMQPMFLWFCFFVNVLFVLLKGPSFLKVKQLGLALLIAAGAGLGCVLVYYVIFFVYKRVAPRILPSDGSKGCGPSQLSSRISRLFGLDDEDEDKENSPKSFSFRTKAQAEQEEPPQPKRATSRELETVASEAHFVPLLIISALSVACAHGGNDVGNAVGPLSAIAMVEHDGRVASKPTIPAWALIYGTIGFVLGILTMGRLTIKTVGTKITALCPSKSFATQMGGAIAVLGSSAAGLPVSTSHCLVGSVVGIGLFEKCVGTGRLNLSVLSRIFLAWGITIPLSMLVALSLFTPFKHFFE